MDAQARKQYVEAARRSFGEPEYEEDEIGQEAGGMIFIKLRLLAAVFLFAAFVLCDRTGSRFYTYTTQEIISMLQEEQFEPQVESLRQAWNEMQEK